MTRSGIRHPSRSGAVRPQLQGGCIGQLRTPVTELPVEFRALEESPLPDRIVGILDRQGFQGATASLAEGRVQRGEFPVEDADRPANGNDVMKGPQQKVL